MKKSFTLIELLIVLVIVSVLLSSVLFIGWNYIRDMQFKNDKEKFVSTYNNILSHSLSSGYYSGEKYDTLFWKATNQQGKIKLEVENENQKFKLGSQNLPVSFFSGFFYSGATQKFIPDGEYIFNSYEIGCYFSGDGNFYETGSVEFDLVSELNKSKYCFYVDLNSCKLFEYKC